MTHHITIKNKISEITQLAVEIEAIAKSYDFSMSETMNLSLVMEEAVSNVINYGFDDDKEHDIHITISIEDDIMSIRVEDDGKAFDPTAADDPDINLSVEERPIGGLGIFLINQLMEKVEYKRENNKNIFMMSKTLKTD